MPSILDGLGNSMLGQAMEKSLGTTPKAPKSLIPLATPPVEQAPAPELVALEQAPPVQQPPPVEKPTEQPPPVDPYAPLKQRLGERPVDEWLSEVDSVAREKDEALARAQELEDRYNQTYERLVEYDIKNSIEYQENVNAPIQKAAEHLVFIIGDNETAKATVNIWNETKDNMKARRERLMTVAQEQGISLGDLQRALDGYMETHVRAQRFVASYEETQKTKQAAKLREMEESQKAIESTQLRMRRTGIYAAEARVKELGIPHLDGFDEASKAWEKTVIDAQSGRQIDYNAEVAYSIIGRLVMSNLKSFKGSFKELEDFKAATRSNPTTTVPKEKPATTVSDNPLLKNARF